ncbi:hypothetical protein [Bordetella trematum]|uniref:hypothetical protein n=1 Tax=Bordetella trematum TaxID=123899 RepID=UPI00047283D4|nr:hypothetical protein [Bordetella trematum]
MADLFYLQDSRSYVGNDMLFWRPDGGGYTTDLREAATYTREEAQEKHNSRATDIPWPKGYIDAKTRPACDMQYVRRDEALAESGITLREQKAGQAERLRCHECRSFISDVNFWAGECPRCGVANRP